VSRATIIYGMSPSTRTNRSHWDFRSKQQIKDAVLDNDFLKHLDSVQIRELVESMYSRDVDMGEFIVRENDPGNHLFVSAQGKFEIIVNDKVLGILPAGKAFGELAILYNCRRTASIRGTFADVSLISQSKLLISISISSNSTKFASVGAGPASLPTDHDADWLAENRGERSLLKVGSIVAKSRLQCAQQDCRCSGAGELKSRLRSLRETRRKTPPFSHLSFP
jgi:Cyclic nucleotide-binding domain